MDAQHRLLSVPALRELLLAWVSKFALSLEYGACMSDLEEMRTTIINISDLLLLKAAGVEKRGDGRLNLN